MVTFVFPVVTEQGFSNLQQSLRNLAPYIPAGSNVLCLTNSEELYPICRNELPEIFVNAGDMNRSVVDNFLAVYKKTNKLIFEAKQYIPQEDILVFLWNECVILPRRTIAVLMELYEKFPKAGFVSGHFVEFPVIYYVEDVYKAEKKTQWNNENLKLHSKGDSIVEVDTTTPYGMLTKTQHFLEFFEDKEDNTNSLSYGIKLRQKGYTNYIDTKLTYRYGGQR